MVTNIKNDKISVFSYNFKENLLKFSNKVKQTNIN